ncbi:MAG: hypothetical protein WAM82_22990 [Thermoanaerobaculia bacterium]
MVNMLAGESPPSIRDAAARCCRGMSGDPKKHIERLRRRYRTLAKRGKLPLPETPASRLQAKVAELRAMYEHTDARIEVARRDLVLAEDEAKALGLDIEGPKLQPVLAALDLTKDRLESLTIYPTEIAYSHYRNQGLTVDQAEERLIQETAKLQLVKEQIEITRKVRDLRAIAGIPYHE